MQCCTHRLMFSKLVSKRNQSEEVSFKSLSVGKITLTFNIIQIELLD